MAALVLRSRRSPLICVVAWAVLQASKGVQGAYEKKIVAANATQKGPRNLPSRIAGERPANRIGGSTSRHRLITDPASIALLFNCHSAAFDVTSCSSSLQLEELPPTRSFDLVRADKSRICTSSIACATAAHACERRGLAGGEKEPEEDGGGAHCERSEDKLHLARGVPE